MIDFDEVSVSWVTVSVAHFLCLIGKRKDDSLSPTNKSACIAFEAVQVAVETLSQTFHLQFRTLGRLCVGLFVIQLGPFRPIILVDIIDAFHLTLLLWHTFAKICFVYLLDFYQVVAEYRVYSLALYRQTNTKISFK
jgi:hypothetical protein